MFKYNDYVIDFDRVNQLTAHPNDNPNGSAGYAGPAFCYGLTRKILKEYLEIYTSRSARIPKEEYLAIVEALHYNKILVNKSDMRERKIDKVLENPF